MSNPKKDKQYVFSESLTVGGLGESIMKQHLEHSANVKEVLDVSHEPEYQDKDIDFVVTLKNRKDPVTVEVKTDTYKSGNFFFETVSNSGAQTQGCMYKSKADFILYYFLGYDKVYMIKRTAFLRWFEEMQQQDDQRAKEAKAKGEAYTREFQKKSVWNKASGGRKGYRTEGYVFAISKLESTLSTYRKDTDVCKHLGLNDVDLTSYKSAS